MALTFPLSLADFSDKLGIATLTPRQGLQQELSSQGSGDEIAADLSPAKREYDVVCSPQYHGDAGQLMALIESLRGPMNTFYISDPRYPAPAADPGGALLLNGSSVPIGGIAALGDFTTGVYALDGTTAAQSDAISNTRASTATYFDSTGTMQTAATDALRFDYDPITHASRGILVEPSATNLFKSSGDFTGTGWSVNGGSVSADQLIAPDGTLTGDIFVEDTSTATTHRPVQTSPTLTIGQTYVFSGFFQKWSANRQVNIQIDGVGIGANGEVVYNFDTGVLTKSGPITIAGVIAYPNGWYRLYGFFIAVAAGTVRVLCCLYNSTGGGQVYTGDGVSGLGMWGAQFEAASAGQTLPSSYIPTAASAVTRAADSPVLKGRGTNSWTAVLDDGSGQSLGGATGNLTILPANLNRPRIKSYQATRLAQPGPATVTINSLNANNKAMSLAGLPPGYVITRGDFLAWDYGSSPTRRAYLRAAETVTANPAGVTPEFQLSDYIKPGSTTGLTVTLIKPAFKAKLISGSVQEQAGSADPMFTSLQFSVRQAL